MSSTYQIDRLVISNIMKSILDLDLNDPSGPEIQEEAFQESSKLRGTSKRVRQETYARRLQSTKVVSLLNFRINSLF